MLASIVTGQRIEDAVFALYMAALVWSFARRWYPYDWRGRRKSVTLKRFRRPWE